MKEFGYVLKTSAKNPLPTGYLMQNDEGGMEYTDDIFKARFIDIDNPKDLEIAYRSMRLGYYNLVLIAISVSVEFIKQKVVQKQEMFTVEDLNEICGR